MRTLSLVDMEDIEEVNDALEDEVSDTSGESKKGEKDGSRRWGRFCSLLSCVAKTFINCKKKKKRREEIEISQSPQNGLTIRMLRDQKASPECGGAAEGEAPRFDTLEVSLESSEVSKSPVREVPEDDDDDHSSIFVPRVSSFSGGQDAEERLLSRTVGRASTSKPRFLTLHRRRRRRPPTRGLVKETAILDDLYNGPTQCVLKGVSFWDFNAFVLDSVCGGRPVTFLCVFLLHQYNLLSLFSLDAVTVWKCFSLIEDGYHASNPYHNAIHAADVTQAMHCYLSEKSIDRYLTPFEKLAAILASVCHDLDHPGVNQPFLIATDNHLAALYNNASVLENHHWRCAMGCLWESGMLDSLNASQVQDLQSMIRSLILATDITRQSEFLVRFKRYQDTGTLDLTDAECRHFCLQIALKCADICNPCRPWETSRQWSQKICDEFYRQGDYERQLSLPVTSMCDRYSNSVANIQAGFIKFVVAPLFESWDRWLNTGLSNSMLVNLQANLQRWETVLREEGIQDAIRTSAAERLEVEGGPQRSDSSTTSSSSREASERDVTCPILGRRHSLPLNMPSLLPRTVIRRESLTGEGGAPPLVYETLKMGESVVDSVVTVGVSGREQPFFPTPSIATMGELGKPRRMTPHTARVQQRRQSLPPLWDSSSIPNRLPLQPLPPTPLQEELPLVEMDITEEEKVPLLKKNGSGTGGGSSGFTSSKGSGNGKDGGGEGTSSSSHRQSSSERRSSITRNIPLELHEEVDKENVAPVGDRGDKPPHNILKTRLWRSLNQEDDLDLQVIRATKGVFKQQTHRMGRRGSAPLLKPEEPRNGNIRSGYDRPLHELPKRRGSAPSHQLTAILGSDALALLSEERIIQHSTPLLTRQNAIQIGEKNLFGIPGARSGQRRGSMPWECHKTDYHAFLSSHSVKTNENCSNMPFSDGGGGLPSGFTSSDAHGNSMGGGGVTPSSLEYRRGSAGFELMSGLWRMRLEHQGSSLCSDESVGVSSSGGGTPGTPGVNPTPFQGHPLMPGPMLRRGSLPTDVFIGGDFERWSGMDPS